MNNSNDTKSNFLARGMAFPAWSLILVAVLLLLIALLKIVIPNFLLVLIAIALFVIGLLPAKIRPPTGYKMELFDSDAPDYKIILSNIPEGVTPTLQQIEDRERSKNYPKDGVGEILFIAGDLVFYKDGKEVNSFSSPIKLTYKFTEQDEARLMTHAKSLIKSKEIENTEEVKFIPIYLYFKAEEPEIKVWKPFQNYTIDQTNRTVTIEFMFWGDQQFGGGTRP